jgi:hypothetical protein
MPKICRLCNVEYEDSEHPCLCGHNSFWGPWYYGFTGVGIWIRFKLSKAITAVNNRILLPYWRKDWGPK